MRPTLLTGGFAVVALVVTLGVVKVRAADEVPRSFVASPDVYRVIAENDQYRVIEATWKPGQKDKFHSHGAVVASYLVTDCKSRNHLPDGTTKDNERKAGNASVRTTGLNHAQENIGTAPCKIIIFEQK